MPSLHQPALVEHGDRVGEAEGLVDVVRHEDHRLGEARLQVAELVLQAGADERIERAEGLVHQQDRRIGGQGAGEADALALAAAQLRGIASGELSGSRPSSANSSRTRWRRRGAGQPSRRGTTSALSAAVRCGKRPASWTT